ncbi:MAG TPA: DinB family protein [Bellilinea sp.]|nr:DinB family protein [Bellilinea sp.]
MTLTVLIDLDDTLLSNDIDVFQKAYFKRLAQALEPWVPGDEMMSAMMTAVQAMLVKKTPALTMEEQFDAVFYPQIGVSKAELTNVIRRFYAEVFPELRKFTTPRPEAVDLIHHAVDRGWDVVVATNPLFPYTAIEQRLEWAGLPPTKTGFKWITSFETAHFSKTHPAYYAEILGQLNWPSTPVVMIGNSLEDDILPAEQLGLATYWLHEGNADSPKRNPLSETGKFGDVLPWLERIDRDQSTLDLQNESAIFATLQSTPGVLDNLSRNLTPSVWAQRPAEGEWNFIEILAHLRDVDREVNFGRVQQTIRGENPFLPAANTDPWVQERNYTAEPGLAALQGFIQSRTTLLKLLDGATPEDLANSARHAIFGPTTLKELLGFVATHDRTHIHQAWNAIQNGH